MRPSVVFSVRVEFTGLAQRETKAQQHLFFRNLQASVGQQLLGASEDALVHDRLGRRSALDPSLIRVLDQLLRLRGGPRACAT